MGWRICARARAGRALVLDLGGAGGAGRTPGFRVRTLGAAGAAGVVAGGGTLGGGTPLVTLGAADSLHSLPRATAWGSRAL